MGDKKTKAGGALGRALRSPWLWGAAALAVVLVAALLWFPPLAQKDYAPVNSGSFATVHPEDRVNLNTATLAELQVLPGIGAQRAAAILEYREAQGPFENIEQLLEVPGIGEGILSGVAPYITVE